MSEEEIDFMDMYVLAHEFHYTPDQIKKMDLVDKADLISFWQGFRETERKQSEKGHRGSKKSGKKFDEDQIIQDLIDQKERQERANGP